MNGQNHDQQGYVLLDSVPGEPALWTAEADYLLWIFPNRETSFVGASTKPPKSVALGTLGDEQLHRHLLTGGQFALGYWYTDSDAMHTRTLRTAGAEVRFFFLGERSIGFANDTSPNIVRPFFDLNNHKESGVIVAAPGLATGGIAALAKGSFRGAEANLWKNIYHDSIPYNMVSVDVMAGFRYLGLDQDIDIRRATTFLKDLKAFPEFAGFEKNRIQEGESFTTRNNFYGGQVGVSGNLFLDKVVLNASAKLALGTTHENLSIDGFQVRTLADGTKKASHAALLALPSNIGNHQRNHFAQVPELGLKASCPILDHVTFTTGFTALYWSRIARAGDQIDRGIDITQIPNFPAAAKATPTGFPRPGVPFDQSSLWVIGANLGLEISW